MGHWSPGRPCWRESRFTLLLDSTRWNPLVPPRSRRGITCFSAPADNNTESQDPRRRPWHFRKRGGPRRANSMPTKESILTIIRIAAWAALMALGGVTLSATRRGWVAIDSRLFLVYLFGCSVMALYIAYDNWEKSHRLSRFLTVVVLSSVAGAALGGLMGRRVFADVANSPRAVVGARPPSSNRSTGARPGYKPQSDGVPGNPGASAAASRTASPTSSPTIGSSAPQADLSLTNNDTPDPVTIRTPLTSRLTVTNRGPATASAVVLTDTLPPEVWLINATPSQGTCSSRNRVVTCALGKIRPRRNVAIDIVARPERAATVRNTATVTSTEEDPRQANNTAVTTTVVAP